VFRETASGARADRAAIAPPIGQLETVRLADGDRPDRLADLTRDVLNTLAASHRPGPGLPFLAYHGSAHDRARALDFSVQGWLADSNAKLSAPAPAECPNAPRHGVKSAVPENDLPS